MKNIQTALIILAVSGMVLSGCGAVMNGRGPASGDTSSAEGQSAAEDSAAAGEQSAAEDMADEDEASETVPDQPIVWLGDSLTQGSLGDRDDNLPGAPYEKLKLLVDVPVEGYGYYGATTHDVLWVYTDKDNLNQIADPNKTYIFWLGSNDWCPTDDEDINSDTGPVIDEIDRFLHLEGSIKNYIVIGTTSRHRLGDLYVPINQSLEEHYGKHYLDVIDIIERHGYSPDNTHLSQSSYDAVALAVYDKLIELGYISQKEYKETVKGQPIVWLGASHTQGSLGDDNDNLAGAPYETLKKLVDVPVEGHGFYGCDAHTILWAYKDKSMLNQIADPTKTYIFWMGTNDWVTDEGNNTDTAPVIDEIDRFLNLDGEIRNYIVIGTVAKNQLGDMVTPINNDLKEHYGEHFLDLLYIVEEHGFAPDNTHLSQESYDAVAEAVYEKLKLLGYI